MVEDEAIMIASSLLLAAEPYFKADRKDLFLKGLMYIPDPIEMMLKMPAYGANSMTIAGFLINLHKDTAPQLTEDQINNFRDLADELFRILSVS